MSLPARDASAELSASEGSEERIPEGSTSLDLPQFLAMLECRDATRRVAALQSVNHSIFEATDGNEASKIFRKVVSMLNDPVWDVKRAAIRLLSELGPRFGHETMEMLHRLLSHPDPLVQLMIACVLKNVEGAEDCCQQIWGDRSTAEAALSHQGLLLEFLDASFKGDREIVLAAVKQDGQALKYAEPCLCDDEEIVLAAVAQSGSAVHFASQKIIARHEGLRALREGRGHGLCGDYLMMEHLGKGAFGEVTEAEHMSTKHVVAIKKVSYDPEVFGHGVPAFAVLEVALVRKFEHPNVVRLLDVHVGRYDIQMVFELHPADLRMVLKQSSGRMSIEEVRQYSANILDGLCACHTIQLLHRDIKPQNILVSAEGILKIADFGQARISDPQQPLTLQVVTLWYRSPELLLGAARYGFEVDCWSAGCVIAEMCTGRPLFPGGSQIDTLLQIFQLLGTPSCTNWPQGRQLHHFRDTFPKWPGTGLQPVLDVRPGLCAHEGHELLSGLLCLQPDRRLSSRQACRHQFCRHG
ncbi:cdk1 [Symbiodinium natans]|uniref:Cyclin-dependent kinase 2 homolog n=1 Tax=Symbiodinium natans TaxID=878477 RepID=A0A812UJI1_9DINO|nr:cdk1 [Symbiodinium natans]